MGMRKDRLVVLFMALCIIFSGCTGRKEADYDLDAARIREDTVYLCRNIGIRVTGTEKEKQAADWITESLREAITEWRMLWRS